MRLGWITQMDHRPSQRLITIWRTPNLTIAEQFCYSNFQIVKRLAVRFFPSRYRAQKPTQHPIQELLRLQLETMRKQAFPERRPGGIGDWHAKKSVQLATLLPT